MQFRSHAVFYLKKALKRYHVKMLLRGWLLSQKRPSPWKLFFLQMGPRHLQWQESVLSEYIAGGEGGKSPGILNLSCGRIPNISFFEMQTFLRLQYIERAADLIWGTFTAIFRILWWYTENRVNLTSTSAPNLKHSKKKVQKIHQTHDDPRGPRKKKNAVVWLFFFVTTIQNWCALFALVVLGVSIACNGVSTKKRIASQHEGVNRKLSAGPYSTSFEC